MCCCKYSMESCKSKVRPNSGVLSVSGFRLWCYPLRALGSKYFGAVMRSAFPCMSTHVAQVAPLSVQVCGSGASWLRLSSRRLQRTNSSTTRRCTRPPTAYARSSLRLPAAGELGRCVAARGLDGSAAVFGLFALMVVGGFCSWPLASAFLWPCGGAAFRFWCRFWFSSWRGLVALALLLVFG